MIELQNLAAALMVVFAGLAFFDGVYLHLWRYRLFERDDTRREHILHTLRAMLFPVWLYLLFGVRSFGWALIAAVAVAGLDLLVQMGDMWEESRARKRFGGLSRGEYILHVWLTAIHSVGLALTLVARPVGDYSAPFALAPAANFSNEVTWLLLPGAIGIAALHVILCAGRFRKSGTASAEMSHSHVQ